MDHAGATVIFGFDRVGVCLYIDAFLRNGADMRGLSSCLLDQFQKTLLAIGNEDLKLVGAQRCLRRGVAADLLITRGQYDDPVAGRQVLHFSISMATEEVRIERVWEAMGMRGTGSHTAVLDNDFVPEQAITLWRACGEYHHDWDVTLTVALPLICAVYIGIAEAAAEKACAIAAKKGDDGVNALFIGEMLTELTTAQIALESMIANVNELNVEPRIPHANQALIRKTIVAEAVQRKRPPKPSRQQAARVIFGN
jgi:alkylation response protein AidB-like acyl-CoA dehydrogenase